MPRPRSVAGGRPVVVPVRLSTEEVGVLDSLRGPLSRSEAIRRLINGQWTLGIPKKSGTTPS